MCGLVLNLLWILRGKICSRRLGSVLRASGALAVWALAMLTTRSTLSDALEYRLVPTLERVRELIGFDSESENEKEGLRL
jgi:hypothetical protein